MDAPTYPPAIVFEQPIVASRELSVRNYSTAELMAMPAAWAVVVKHLPAIRMIVTSTQAKAGLANMTVEDYARVMGPQSAPALTAIDAELRHLPADGGAGR